MCLRLPNLHSFAPLIALLCWSSGFSQVANPAQGGYGVANRGQASPPEGIASRSSGGDLDSANLLLAAAKAQAGRHSIAAKIRQTVHLFGQELIGSGVYLEQDSPQGLQFRLELKLQRELGKQPSSLLQVCDGRYLWRYRLLGKEESLTRVDVVRVARALEESGQMARIQSLGEWPATGGVPRMLAGLVEAFDFSPPQRVLFKSQLPAWRIEGRWKKSFLSRAGKATEKDSGIDLGALPSHLPNRVEIFLGREDLFPARIAYYRLDPGETRLGKATQPVVAIDFLYVEVNVPIHPARFVYRPGDVDVHDATNEYLHELGVR